jgi:hypothetical protein
VPSVFNRRMEWDGAENVAFADGVKSEGNSQADAWGWGFGKRQERLPNLCRERTKLVFGAEPIFQMIAALASARKPIGIGQFGDAFVGEGRGDSGVMHDRDRGWLCGAVFGSARRSWFGCR